MLDLKWIRDNPQALDEALERRGAAAASPEVRRLDEARREHLQVLQGWQSRRNEASKEIGKAKASGDAARADAVMAEVADLKAKIQEGERQERQFDEELNGFLATLPNAPLADVPRGADEADNVEVRRSGQEPAFAFKPKEHFELGEALGQMDFDAAARMSGSRFTVLRGKLARLERALGQFMLDMHTGEFGYEEVSPPLLVRDDALFGTGQLPKFAEDLFRTTDGRWMIPTAEVSLTNLVREQIVDEAKLPMRFTALTPSFRSEAGSAGRDTRGMLRQHQFYKAELVSITTPETSLDEHERMTRAAETVLERLGLHFRTVVLCTGDMGFSSQKTYDIEVWLPGQDAFREISSCSVCGDFQARRMNARFRPAGEKVAPRFVHTLNGSGTAVGRALIAIMENYQTEAGEIRVPEALRPYMGGLEIIGRD
ncbi:serine--tRNA ligase [Aureimonas phyllosphaerae]|uniref:Serine--tRNA ligase n=1 Tax=Aureimonas phyllosphaerae TaxID=1166078 RepID=A0A7W6FTI3_9HYPH|nr:serine--tRNA ligase [Aureimonas phyllosphaerae]MBB3935073.1 seryl-tRNA synthetase [Aureimonas phyllosphaerae]MBB3959081.1 seryl-tRNA synthetase [Aureimonas phyllosphaerae]SFF08189.1 seryl-tRNA synthetase [Aureimonas phyllosphaerae]